MTTTLIFIALAVAYGAASFLAGWLTSEHYGYLMHIKLRVLEDRRKAAANRKKVKRAYLS